MNIKINCYYNDDNAWCINKNITRSLFGFGARCCVLYPNFLGSCQHQIKSPKPKISPGPDIPQGEKRCKIG